MSSIKKNIQSFIELGDFLQNFIKQTHYKKYDVFYDKLDNIVKTENVYNQWFIQENVLFAIKSIADELNSNNIEKWLAAYKINEQKSKKIGVVTAGNIPLVGFHDFISVLILNHIFIGKLSSKDNRLIKFIAELLSFINPDFKNKIFFTDKLADFEAIIATGSDNSAKYFDYYFGKYPNIIRKNRSSVAILTGKETPEDIKNLGTDIFSYFGLGCRNVSKIFIPENYDIKNFFEPLSDYYKVIDHHKYANNYDYNKAIFMMNKIPIFDNNFLILKEDIGYSSPIAVVYYERYKNQKTIIERLEYDKEKLQCVVTDINIDGKVNFGKTQKPKLWEYADNIDTINFLISL